MSLQRMSNAISQVLAQAEQQEFMPQQTWQKLGETVEEFDRRVRRIRKRLPASIPLLAACGPHPEPIDGVTLVEMTEPMLDVVHPSHSVRYRVGYGGRARGGTWCCVRAAVLASLTRTVRVLCARENQNS